MKRKLIVWGALLLLPLTAWATGENAVCRSTATGLLCGENANAYLGFNGHARVRQSSSLLTPQAVLQNYGLMAAGQDYSLQHATVAITAANIIAMYTTPKALIAAPSAGHSIVVQKLVLTTVRTSTAFTSGGVAIVQYDSTANGAGTQALDSTVASTVVTGSTGTTVTARNGAVISDLASTSIQAKGLYLSNQTGVFATGTGTATVDIWYYVL
jgi:hypothetical protein